MKKTLQTLLAVAVLLILVVPSASGSFADLRQSTARTFKGEMAASYKDPRLSHGVDRREMQPEKQRLLSATAARQNDARRAGLRASLSGTTVCGIPINSDLGYGFVRGYYELNTSDGSQSLLWANYEMEAITGFLLDGNLYVFNNYNMYDVLFGANCVVYNAETGVATGKRADYEAETTYKNFVSLVAYDPTEAKAFCYSYNDDMSRFTFQTFDPETMALSVVCELDDRPVALTYNALDKKLYGIDFNGNLVTVNKADGSMTVVGNTGVNNNPYIQGLCYSMIEGRFIWAACETVDNKEVTNIYAIDPATAKASFIAHLPNNEEYGMLVCTDCIEAGAPAAPVIASMEFEGGSLSGKISVVAPVRSFDNQTLVGELSLVLKIDGSEVARKNVQPGKSAVFDVTAVEGKHDVAVVAVSDGKEGISASAVVCLGFDTPPAPSDVKLSDSRVTWTAVEAVGVNGGYVDPSQIGYNVWLNGVRQNETPVNGNSLDITFPDGTQKKYRAMVETTASGKVSEPAYSNELLHGRLHTPPYTAVPTAADFDLFSIVDNNDDKATWMFDEASSAAKYALSNMYEPADDYLFLPALQIDDVDKLYELSVEAYCQMSEYPEKFEIVVSTTPDPSGIEYMSEIYTCAVKEPVKYSTLYGFRQAGVYYVGFHAVSDADMLFLFLRNFSVQQTGVTKNYPAEVTDLKAVAGEKGALNATVTFCMPVKSIVNKDMDANTVITATVSSGKDSKPVSGAPGEAMSVTLATDQGFNTIAVVTGLEVADGRRVETEVYTGIDTPKAPVVTSTTSDDNMTMHLEWTMEPVGVNGGYVDIAACSYNTYFFDGVNIMWRPVEKGLASMSFDYVMDDGVPLEIVNIGVQAVNGVGENTEIGVAQDVLGVPLEMPFEETYRNAEAQLQPLLYVVKEENATAAWEVVTGVSEVVPETGDVNVAMVCMPRRYGAASVGEICLPKFSTVGASKARFSINLFCGGVTPVVKAYARVVDSDFVEIGTVEGNLDENLWKTIHFDLPDGMQNRRWVQVKLRVEFSGEKQQFAFINRYFARNNVDRDLAVSSITGPGSMLAGESGVFKAVVSNYGNAPMAVPAVSVKVTDADGRVLDSREVRSAVSGDIAHGETAEYSYSYDALLEHLGNLAVEVSLAGSDESPVNDCLLHRFNVYARNGAIVTDLGGVATDGSVVLSWSDPVAPKNHEDFESLDRFTADCRLGDFINRDLDGKPCFYFSNLSFPGDTAPKAFQVFSTEYFNNLGFADFWPAFSGDRYLMVMCPIDGTAADDWLISPEIAGGSEVSFRINILNDNMGGPERLRVLYSVTDDDVASFVELKVVEKISLDWESVTFTLPAEARYFALNYVSEDVFGMMVDDISYVPAWNAGDISAYNVYRDGKLIASSVAGGAYTDASAGVDDNKVLKYNVAAVVKGVEHAMSNTATVSLLSGVGRVSASGDVSITGGNGFIVVDSQECCDVMVYAADGCLICVRKSVVGMVSIPAACGTYVVRAGESVAKVVVK